MGEELYLYFEGELRRHLRKKLRKSDFYFAKIAAVAETGIKLAYYDEQYVFAIVTDRIFPKTHPIDGHGIILLLDDPHFITEAEFSEMREGGKKKIKEFAEISGFDYKTLKKAVEAYLANN